MILKFGEFHNLCYGEIIREDGDKLVDYSGVLLRVQNSNPYGNDDAVNDRGIVFYKKTATRPVTFVLEKGKIDLLVQDIINYNVILKGEA